MSDHKYSENIPDAGCGILSGFFPEKNFPSSDLVLLAKVLAIIEV